MTLDELKSQVGRAFAAHGLDARPPIGRTTLSAFGDQWPPELDPGAQADEHALTVLVLRESEQAVVVPHTAEHLNRLRAAAVAHSNFRTKTAFDPTHASVAAYVFPFACRGEVDSAAIDELVAAVRARFGL